MSDLYENLQNKLCAIFGISDEDDDEIRRDETYRWSGYYQHRYKNLSSLKIEQESEDKFSFTFLYNQGCVTRDAMGMDIGAPDDYDANIAYKGVLKGDNDIYFEIENEDIFSTSAELINETEYVITRYDSANNSYWCLNSNRDVSRAMSKDLREFALSDIETEYKIKTPKSIDKNEGR